MVVEIIPGVVGEREGVLQDDERLDETNELGLVLLLVSTVGVVAASVETEVEGLPEFVDEDNGVAVLGSVGVGLFVVEL